MAYQQKPGEFILFKNDKQENPSRPDYTGDGLGLDGVPIRVAAWIKQGKNGKFMACKIQPKVREQTTRKSEPVPNKREEGLGGVIDMDSDIPF